ncbi:hypothetical protein [Brevibacillus laterosporus]|uniref:hypothetical protein n=1 Tax=Brevibacillus laterosporus TaxID=1465 RepID=UPI00399D6BB6
MTALFEARDRISPELIRMRRETDRTGRSFGGMRKGFQRESQRMEREIQSLRSDLKRLESIKARPRVELDNQATQGISDLRQQLMGLAGLAAGITIGANAGGIMTDLQAAFKERALYAAKGKTQEEIKAFDKRSKDLVNMNPYLNLQESMAIQSRSEQLNGKKGGAYAEEAAKLGVTTKYSSDEHLKMLSVMSKSMEIDDSKRLANSIQYMSNNLVDFKDEFVDSVVEYTVQTSKFLDTPEKLATLVGEIGKLGVWSDDKALDALKESSLKFTNQGDLANVLKTGFETGGMKSEDAQKKAESEAEIINELLHSDNEADNKSAMGRLMMAVATIEDKNMRQQVLNELGAGPGEDLAKHFAPLLEVAGKISTGELKSKVANNEAEKAYKLAVDSNPLFEYQQAQNNAKQAVMDFGAKLAKDATPALTSLSKAAGWVAEKFNGLSDTTRTVLELAGVGGVLLGSGYMLIRSAKMQMMAAQALKRAAGGSGDFDFDSDGRKNKKEKGKGKGKKRSWNPFKRDKSVPKGLSPEDAKRMAFYGSEPAKQGMWDKAKNFGGKAVGGIKSVGGSIARKVPYIGTAAGVGMILASEDSDKVTSLARMGAEIGGGALGGAVGGAVTGAIVGSVVPGIGTAVGAAIGGAGALIGSAIGAWGGGELFDKAKEWWFGKEEPPDTGPSRSKEEIISSIVDPLKGMAMKTAMGQTVSQLADKFSPGIQTWWKGQVRDYAIKNGMPVPEDKSFSDVIKPLEASVKKMVMNTGMGQVGSQLFEKYSPDIKKWWDGQVKDYAQKLSVPTQSPASKKEEKPKLATLTVPSLPITLHADGVLQDVAGMLRLLKDPSVTNEIKRIIETAFINAIETGGGKA